MQITVGNSDSVGSAAWKSVTTPFYVTKIDTVYNNISTENGGN